MVRGSCRTILLLATLWCTLAAASASARPRPHALTHPVRFISAARAELERAQDWYEAQRPGLGTQFVERVDEAVAKIAKHPEAYQQIINDVRRAAIPQFPYALCSVSSRTSASSSPVCTSAGKRRVRSREHCSG